MHDTAAHRPAQSAEQPSGMSALRSMLPTIVINGVLPFLLYRFLKSQGVATVPALVAGSIFPVISTIWSWIKTRQPDLIGILSLIFILLSAAASLISGSARFTLLKESFFTGLFGLVFLASILVQRPAMFYIIRQFNTGGDAEKIAEWDRNRQHGGFRHAMAVITAIWGVMFIADALVRVALVFILSVSAFLIVSQVLFYGMFALTFFITMAYGRRARQQGQEARARREAAAQAP